MKRIFLAFFILVFVSLFLLFFRFFFGGPEDEWICEYGSWVKHGNPGAPMPTAGCGSAFVDKVEEKLTDSSVCYSPNGNKTTYEDAYKIAVDKCVNGKLQENHFCNDSTGTWWIDFVPNEVKEGCNPACVVFVDTGETEINWRCTGLQDAGM